MGIDKATLLQNLKWDLKQSEIKKKALDGKIQTWKREKKVKQLKLVVHFSRRKKNIL